MEMVVGKSSSDANSKIIIIFFVFEVRQITSQNLFHLLTGFSVKTLLGLYSQFIFSLLVFRKKLYNFLLLVKFLLSSKCSKQSCLFQNLDYILLQQKQNTSTHKSKTIISEESNFDINKEKKILNMNIKQICGLRKCKKVEIISKIKRSVYVPPPSRLPKNVTSCG